MIPLNAPELERAVRGSLGLDLRLAVAARPLDATRLSPAERPRFAALAAGARRTEWLTGRAALKRLLTQLGSCTDTAGIAFPSPRYSLAHSGGVALAAGLSGTTLRGIGVDLELRQRVDPRAARLFLSARERLHVRAAGARAEVLRLWTIKEALYKSDPENAGRVLADYCLIEPACGRGRARLASGGTWFTYSSFPVPGGFASIAFCF